ncbi:Cgl0159 family (beta/alpha)8-fold protein [Amycolatopsis eburnea]|uniref:Aldolase n=1 Tax=Amycolatopsis eburnea TaxID=2267691 RepID=A0A427TJ05_9PSEU|nr:aldolase [Amycolatopsis eburnea]RSD23817.1 aldolase [Amycolatopsis eburnea]
MLTDDRWRDLLHTRATNPGAVRQAYATRKRRSELLSDNGTLFLVAAEAPGPGDDPFDRRTLLERLLVALENPAVAGVVATPDVVEELLLLGALHDKVVFGSMNPDDRFTGYDARTLVDCGLDGGELLLSEADPSRQACADAVTELAAYGLVALIDLRENPASPAVTVASGLGTTSAHTWLKLPPTCPAAALDATTLPVVLSGVPSDWTLSHGVVRGLVIGRPLLNPPSGTTRTAVEAAAKALEAAK